MMATAEDTTPRVWVGCLACYNAGRLVGGWFDGDQAGEVAPADAHAYQPFRSGAPPGHEELWVFDHEGYAGTLDGECSPAEAQRLAELLDEVDDPEAYGAYAANVGREYATPEEFAEAYCGEWDDIDVYAYELVADLGLLDGVNETVARYFDHAAFARDLVAGGDYYTADASGGRVFVFRAV